MEPAVVIWATNQRPFEGSALAAVLRTYQEPPVRVLTFKLVPPAVKYPEIVGDKDESSTSDGSAAFAMPEVAAGPSKPIVA